MSRHDERHEQTLSGRGTGHVINSARYKINESSDPDTLGMWPVGVVDRDEDVRGG